VELPEYTIEAGAAVSDHRILTPRRLTMIGAMSNNPIEIGIGDLAGGALSNIFDDSGFGALAAGISAGVLAGSDQARSSAALTAIIDLAVGGEVFSIDAGDITLQNMLIKSIRRQRTPENENGLILEIDLQEFPTLDRVTGQLLSPKQDQLRDGDPAKSQISGIVDKGQSILAPLAVSQTSQLASFLT